MPVIYYFYPETKGYELEDIDHLFAKAELAHAADVEQHKRESDEVYHNEHVSAGKISKSE